MSVWKLGDDIKVVQCMGYLPTKYSWTFNDVIFSHPGELKQDLSKFWLLYLPYGVIIRDSYYNTVGQVYQNLLKSCLNSPG